MRSGIARSRVLRPRRRHTSRDASGPSTQASSCDENPQDVPDAAVDRDGCGLAGPEPARGRPGLRRRAESTIRESVVKISATMRYPDMVRPWTKQSPQRGQRHGGRHRGQADPDQRPRRALRQPALRRAARSRATSWPRRSRRSARASTWRSSSSRTSRSSTSGPPLPRTDELPEVKDTVAGLRLSARGARACRSPRGSSRGSSSPPTTRAPRACGSRSTRRSTRATAAARPWSTTR